MRKSTCSECRATFQTYFQHQKTCGPICSEIRNSRLKRERKAASGKATRQHREPPKIKRNCDQCRKSYIARHPRGKFCSVACKSAALRDRKKSIEEIVKPLAPVFVEVKPKKLESHTPELQQAINRYLRKGGKVKRYRYLEPEYTYITQREARLIQDLAGIEERP